MLREQRSRAGLSQAALAQAAATSQATISAYETGRKAPSAVTLSRLIDACGAVLSAQRRAHRPASPLLAHVVGHRVEVRRICRSYGGTGIALFGSVASGDDGEASDIDLLVEIAPDRDLFDLLAMEQALTGLLGVPVDVTSRRLSDRDETLPSIEL